MNKYIKMLIIVGGLTTDTASAQHMQEYYLANFEPSNMTIATSLGWLSGSSKEYVYDTDTGRKMSELDWKIDHAPIIKGDISWDPFYWLTFNMRGWITLSSSGSGMDDYDWLDEHQSHWTDWSHSPRTRLNYANEFDINVRNWLIKNPDYKVGTVVGFQQTHFSWTALGGHYQYDNGSDIGDFPRDARSIGYQQIFSMPYIGLTSCYQYGNFEFNALLKFSPWVEAKDNDEHYMRNLTFYEKTNGSHYYSASIYLGYDITRNTKFITEFTWNRYSQGKGGTHIIDRTNSYSDYEGGNAAGIENKNYSMTAGLQYRF